MFLGSLQSQGCLGWPETSCEGAGWCVWGFAPLRLQLSLRHSGPVPRLSVVSVWPSPPGPCVQSPGPPRPLHSTHMDRLSHALGVLFVFLQDIGVVSTFPSPSG